jgi:hypothetical protein
MSNQEFERSITAEARQVNTRETPDQARRIFLGLVSLAAITAVSLILLQR